jgi:proline-specific peptidase
MIETFTNPEGLTLAVHRTGEGPVLVCHPGGPGMSSRYFAGDLGGLDAHFTLVLLDPRGTGGSQAPDDPRAYTTGHYVADVEALRQHLGLEELNLLGHSHGGVVAAAYAAAHPGRVRRLVLVNSLARLNADEMEEQMERRSGEPWYADAREALAREEAGDYETDDELREITSRFWPMYFAHYDGSARAYLDAHLDPERPNSNPLKVFNEDIEAGRFDLRPELACVRAPTLVLTGELDFICGPACAADLADGIPGSTRVVFEDCGHFTFVEKPGRWREEIRRFVL